MRHVSILLVEDDKFKEDRLRASLDGLSRQAEIVSVASVQAAVSAIQNHQYDYILLDMALPSHDLRPGGGPSSPLLSGGLEVVMELSFLRRSDKVVVITQYPEVEIEGRLIPIAQVEETMRKQFSAQVVAVVLYRHDTNDWVRELLAAVGG